MDEKAKDHRRLVERTKPRRCHRIRHEPWPVWIQGRKVCSRLREWVDRATVGAELIEYWKQKGILPRQDEDVNFEARTMALKALGPIRRIWVTKTTADLTPVGVNMHRWKFWSDDKCPRCGTVETTLHTVKCPAADPNWETTLLELKKWLVKAQTAPTLCTAILAGLRLWYDDTTPSGSEAMIRLLDYQSRIGWDSAIKGWISRHWQDHQEKYLKGIKSRKSAKRWSTELIRKLWDIAWDQWEHRNGILHAVENTKKSTLSTLR